MSRFLQLEYAWYDERNGANSGMVIINLDMIMVMNIEMKRVTLKPDLSYNLTERGWKVLMEAIEPHQLSEEQRNRYNPVPTN